MSEAYECIHLDRGDVKRILCRNDLSTTVTHLRPSVVRFARRTIARRDVIASDFIEQSASIGRVGHHTSSRGCREVIAEARASTEDNRFIFFILRDTYIRTFVFFFFRLSFFARATCCVSWDRGTKKLVGVAYASRWKLCQNLRIFK